jgi:hypothetical protein
LDKAFPEEAAEPLSREISTVAKVNWRSIEDPLSVPA